MPNMINNEPLDQVLSRVEWMNEELNEGRPQSIPKEHVLCFLLRNEYQISVADGPEERRELYNLYHKRWIRA